MNFTTRGGNCILSVSLSSSSGRKSSRKSVLVCRLSLVGYSEGDMFVGFISYWEFGSYRYIEHFAVHQGLRGRGYGSEILNAFLRSTSKIVLLEIDPIVDSVSRARLRFYRKCGFHENPFCPYASSLSGGLFASFVGRAYISPVYNRKWVPDF